MSEAMSNPPQDAHVGACGLFCSNCGSFKRGRCKGCQIEPGFKRCAVRLCCIEKGITICAGCSEFESPRDYHECKKVNNFIARIFSFVFGTKRPEALAMLRDQGRDAYLASKEGTKKM